MIILEIIAIFFTVLSVVLTIKQNILCWPIGIFGVIAYGIIFHHEKLYAEMVLQIFFFLQMFYGWIYWKIIKEQEVREIDGVLFIMNLVISFLFIVLISILLLGVFDSSQPLLDASTSVLSLLANYYMAKKIIQGWYLWIFVDILFVFMFLGQSLYMSSILYLCFTVMAYYGFKSWKRNLKTA